MEHWFKMNLLAIDPGNEESAFVLYDTEHGEVIEFGKEENEDVLHMLDAMPDRWAFDHLAIEMIASYGMPVGETIFGTCLWIGRFVQMAATGGCREPRGHSLVYRSEVKVHLCGTMKAKDSNIRQRLIDIFGPGKSKAIGVKNAPGPLYKMKSDEWQALAVAVTFAERKG